MKHRIGFLTGALSGYGAGALIAYSCGAPSGWQLCFCLVSAGLMWGVAILAGLNPLVD